MVRNKKLGTIAGFVSGGAALCSVLLRGLLNHPMAMVFLAFSLAGGLCVGLGVSNIIKPHSQVVRGSTARGMIRGHRKATRFDAVMVFAAGLVLCLGAAAGDLIIGR